MLRHVRQVHLHVLVVSCAPCCWRQVRILRSLKHPNVIDIYQFFKDDPSHYYVSIEFMRGGELFDRIVQKVSYVVKKQKCS